MHMLPTAAAAGRSVGVAKEAAVVGVRVLDCDGAGSIANVISGGHAQATKGGRAAFLLSGKRMLHQRMPACLLRRAGLDWVAANAAKPAVAVLSLGVPAGGWSNSLEGAVRSLVAAGVAVTVAAGNDAADSCGVAPARVPEAITVSASNLPGKFEARQLAGGR